MDAITAADPADEPQRLVGSDRVLAVLIELAGRHEGASLEDLAKAVDSPRSTVHRALGSLVRAGLASRVGQGRYELGDEFLRLAFAYQAARPDHVRVLPMLHALAETFGETAHFAALDGDEVVYRAKVDPAAGAVRLTSTIGGRNPVRCTAVGKVLLARQLPDEQAALAWAAQHPIEARTPRTLVDDRAFAADIMRTKERGYGIDDQENEQGINCVAFVAPGALEPAAVSVSALAYRMGLPELLERLPEMRRIIGVVGE